MSDGWQAVLAGAGAALLLRVFWEWRDYRAEERSWREIEARVRRANAMMEQANVEPVDDATERTVLADYLTEPNEE